jgi:hypothetical protein
MILNILVPWTQIFWQQDGLSVQCGQAGESHEFWRDLY